MRASVRFITVIILQLLFVELSSVWATPSNAHSPSMDSASQNHTFYQSAEATPSPSSNCNPLQPIHTNCQYAPSIHEDTHDSHHLSILPNASAPAPTNTQFPHTQHLTQATNTVTNYSKTTTTSMTTQILFDAGADPSAVIGGKLACIHGSGRCGNSDIMTCEACEFVDTFLKLYPDIAVLLNIDADHLDYFGTVENIIRSFHKFAENTSKVVIYNGDDEKTCKAVEGITGKELITFGEKEGNDYVATNIVHVSGLETHFDVLYHGELLGTVVLHIAGVHNVLNALAAIAAVRYVGISFEDAVNGLGNFHGAGRRFDKKGEACGVTVVDDYGHHPTELTVTLQAAMEMPFHAVWAVFQPFTYARTAVLLDDFAKALSIPTHAVLTDIMGSREKNTYNIFTRQLGEKIPGAVWFPQDETDPESNDERKYKNFADVCQYVCDHVEPGDLVITMGCGDINKVNKMILEELQRREQAASK